MDTFDRLIHLKRKLPPLWIIFAAIFSTIMDAGSDRVMLIMFSQDLTAWNLFNCFSWSGLQWLWHILKWGSFFTWPAMVIYREVVLYKTMSYFHAIVLSFVCFGLWQFIYRSQLWEYLK